MIKLEKKIGSGRHRDCYRHPEDESKCVKILYNPQDGGFKEVKRETGYYRKRARQIKQCRSVPNFHGKVNTNRGEGYVFDLVRDYDGEISKTLEHYLKNEAISQAQLQNKLYDLRNDLIAHNIATMNLKVYNILYRRTGYNEGYLVVIDNIGESEFFPVASLFNFLHRRKIDRIFSRFFHGLNVEQM
ncbi:YrbL family protein [Pantoea sp.]|uniref:YrbL family protein n=1 Tax=Pantoea sp. TaxID=69393 RepID=UPI0028978A30|nr:YrbL family protein [Pantoea sp.]